MLRYTLRRLLLTVPLLGTLSVVVFAMLYLLPGDPASAMLAGAGASAETIAQVREELGLNQPPHVQYLRFLRNALRGDLGRSFSQNRPVVLLIREQFPYTLELAAAALALAVIIGGGLGALAALRHNTWVDAASMAVALVGVSVPPFLLGLILIFVFSFRLGWFPATGQGGPERLVLPALVLGLGAAAVLARLTRAALLDALRQEHLITARGKGLAERAVFLRHAVRNALIPVVTVLGLQVGWLLGGAVVTENVFSRPGLGRLLVDAILAQDFPLVQGTLLVITTSYVLVNLLVDMAYALLDPRLRHAA